MIKRPTFMLLLTLCLLVSGPKPSLGQAQGQAAGNYPVADMVADKIIQKYQNSSCDELKAKKQQPASGQEKPTPMEEKVIQELKNNPDLRKHFLDKIAGPIVNKMFECGMVP
jgi:hypothetical protein